jgi:aspartate-semialdehyde dehydrogenase
MSQQKKKLAVGILGATGMVGQKFIELLADHPWFEVNALAASERSEGKKYAEACLWRMASPLPAAIGKMQVMPCVPNMPCKIVFSGLDSDVAGKIEQDFAHAGYIVISNSKNHRMHADVPLLIPEVNASHLPLVRTQSYGRGMIVTNPNCSVVGLAMALKPLVDRWGVEKAHVVTMQAVSGAGYPGVSSFDILDNVIPFISGEEDKVESEPLKILGRYHEEAVQPYPISISAQCNRVPVMDGHTACVSVKLTDKASWQDIIGAWNNFHSRPQELGLPSAPAHPVVYLTDDRHPQPRLHRYTERGMTVSVGRLRPCPLLDWKFCLLSHNTVRGAAGCAILNAELMLKEGYIPHG